MNYKYCDIVFPIPVERKYTYFIPENFRDKNLVGSRVIVEFGKQKNKIGVVVETFLSLQHSISKENIKPIKEILDQTPFYSTLHLFLAEKIAKKYSVSIGEVIDHFFPIEVKSSINLPVFLHEKENIKILPEISMNVKNILTNKKKNVLVKFNSVKEKFSFYKDTLLYVLSRNQQTVLVFPQRSYIYDFLQYIDDIYTEFKDKIFIYSGEIDIQERYKIWKLVEYDKIKVILSTHIGIFLPIKKSSIIVIDEPDDTGHKNLSIPLYETKEIVDLYQSIENFKVIYGTFIPSIELKYQLKKTYTFSTEPKIKIIFVDKNFSLKNMLTQEIYRFRQCVIFFPTKGYMKYIFCTHCGRVYRCRKCSGIISYDKERNIFYCRLCKEKISKFCCPKCSSEEYKLYGFGIQKILEQLTQFLPEAKSARLDKDVHEKTQHKIVTDFNAQKIDILITTQEILKYIYRINWDNVSLVYFSNLDNILYRATYLAYENVYRFVHMFTFLLSEKNNPVIYLDLYKKDDNYNSLLLNYTRFYKNELKIRNELCYPPYCKIVQVRLFFEEKNLPEIENVITKLNEEGLTVFVQEKTKISGRKYKMNILIKMFSENKNFDEKLYLFSKFKSEKVKLYIDYSPKEF